MDGNRLSEGGRIDRIEVTATRVPAKLTQFVDGTPGDADQTVSRQVRARDGTFELPLGEEGLPVRLGDGQGAGPDDATSDSLVLLYAGVVVDPPGSDPVKWFGMTAKRPVEFAEARTLGDVAVTLSVERRLLTPPDAPVAIWEWVGGPHDTEVVAEARGEVYRQVAREATDPDLDRDREADERSDETELESGLFTLQVPEDVTVQYRGPSGATNRLLEPDGFYTDDIRESTLEAEQLSFLERYAPTEAGPLDTHRPLFPAFREGTVGGYYRPYADGATERAEANDLDLFFDAVNFFLFVAGVVATGGTMGAALAVLGATNGAIKNANVPTPDELPDWHTEGPTYGSGHLPIDHESYDFVTGQWGWNTFGFAQPYPMEFQDDRPAQCCLRGLVRRVTQDAADDGRELVRVQQSFVLNPAVRSPADDPGLTVPQGELDLREPPRADITLSDRSPTAGDTVTFDGFGSTAFGDLDIQGYRWTVAPVGGTLDRHFDADGDGTADLIAPDDYGRTERTEPRFSLELTTPGIHEIYLTVTDETGATDTEKTAIRVTEPAPSEIHPVATDAGEECYFPPTGASFPANGADAAHHLGYGCGDWKVYETVPGESYTIALAVDTCRDCLLYDAAVAVDEPANSGATPDAAAEIDWEEQARFDEEPLGKDAIEERREVQYVADSDRIRVRNVGANGGLGCYVSVYGPTVDRENPFAADKPQ